MNKSFPLVFFTAIFSFIQCETIDDKREGTIDHKLENAAKRVKIMGDSLEKEAEIMEEKANKLKDSTRI